MSHQIKFLLDGLGVSGTIGDLKSCLVLSQGDILMLRISINKSCSLLGLERISENMEELIAIPEPFFSKVATIRPTIQRISRSTEPGTLTRSRGGRMQILTCRSSTTSTIRASRMILREGTRLSNKWATFRQKPQSEKSTSSLKDLSHQERP